MNSYPASCDFMVARPPTYEESMREFRKKNYPSSNSNIKIKKKYSCIIL